MRNYIAVVLALAFLGGCAFTPQQAKLSPTINVAESNEGHNIKIAIRVTDERPSKSLGRRGTGMMNGAEITASEDVATVVKRSLMDGLRKKGFKPVAVNKMEGAVEPHLTVELRLLEYSTSQGFWTGGVEIKGALKAVAINSGHVFEHMYRSDKEERVMVVPTAETNEKWINDALTNVINQVLDDASLLKFLETSPGNAAPTVGYQQY